MKIEEGKFYRTRAGRKVAPKPCGEYWVAGGWHYADNGNCCYRGIAARDPEPSQDLVAEWVEPVENRVDHPSHYAAGGIECYDAMAAMLTAEELIGYLRGNSFKYRWRFRHKGGAEDLRKAEWYEKKLLEIIQKAA